MAKETVDTLCTLGKRALTQGKYEAARQCYLQALGLRSDQPEVHYGLATVCFLLNDLVSAAHHFKEVTRLDPLRAGAFINLGAVYNRLERFEEAITALRRGIQLDGSRAEGYYNLALVYRKRGQSNLAVQAYREATRVNPRMADAHYNLANLYLENAQYPLAIAHYRMALDVRPDWDKAQHSLEMAEAALGAEQSPISAPVEEHTAPETGPNLDAPVDPMSQGTALQQLSQATAKAEAQGRGFVHVLEAEVEPALKEMSSCLLDPTIPASQMEACVRKFETALANMRQAKRAELQGQVAKIHESGNQFLND